MEDTNHLSDQLTRNETDSSQEDLSDSECPCCVIVREKEDLENVVYDWLVKKGITLPHLFDREDLVEGIKMLQKSRTIPEKVWKWMIELETLDDKLEEIYKKGEENERNYKAELLPIVHELRDVLKKWNILCVRYGHENDTLDDLLETMDNL